MAGKYGRKYAKNNEEFEEGEVLWGGVNNNEGKKDMFNNNSSPKHFTTSSSSPTHFFTAPKMIPKSSSSEIFTVGGNKNSSAPLDIPDWSKIYGKKTSKKKKNVTTSSYTNYNNNNSYDNNVNVNHYNNDGYYINGYNDCNGYDNDYCNNDDDDDDMDGMVPPHEYIARKLARNQISSFSVYEGIGRTLKGRDLSKVRNTILSKTGFLE